MSAVEDMSIEARAARLRRARQLEYRSAAQAAAALGMKGVTVRSHENGQNGFPAQTAEKYASAYGVSLEWLLTGRADRGPVERQAARPTPPAAKGPVSLTQLPSGKARLQLDTTLPFSTALQILALVEDGQK